MDHDFFERYKRADSRCKTLQAALTWAKADAMEEAARLCEQLTGADALRCGNELRTLAKRMRRLD